MVLDAEILKEFQTETNQLIGELEAVVGKLEDHEGEAFPKELLEEYALKIDRVMGAAKTLAQLDAQHAGLQRIGKLAELCKTIGYRAAEQNDQAVVPLVGAFFADTLEVLSEMVRGLDHQVTEVSSNLIPAALQGRLEVLAKFFKK